MDRTQRDILLKEVEEILDQIIKSQVPEEHILEQCDIFRKGLPFVRLARPCTIGDGIHVIPESDFERLLESHHRASMQGRTLKFVPASGAATRMFKELSAILEAGVEMTWEDLRRWAQTDATAGAAVEFLGNLERFAFYDVLRSSLERRGLSLETLKAQGRWRDIILAVLSRDGLNYAHLPKGLILFHQSPEGPRTPFHEHLVEAAHYARDAEGTAAVHFTVSEEHRQAVEDHLGDIVNRFGSEPRFSISTSTQRRSTDTIAVTLENEAFRDATGKIVFRPGGHGALLENLNALKGDIIFIKNIDNVVPDRLKPDTILYKKLLCGFLVELQDRLFGYLRQLAAGPPEASLMYEIEWFAAQTLAIVPPAAMSGAPLEARARYYFEKFNRPLRVCGMVENSGEPGGGPFWVSHEDGRLSLQIVESAQVDVHDPDQKRILSASTHFNPVDLVCGVRDFQGRNFHLPDFADPKTGFITMKSKEGKELKALELPGLWNGGMAEWTTVFVEVPAVTFNPVKTVNDLLREEHQP